MNQSVKIVLLILGLCLILGHSPILYAHGIQYSLSEGGLIIKVSFDDHQPAKGLTVTVFAPDVSEKFQTGGTDLNGCFAFFPDRPGEWEILFFDQIGHRLEIKVPVNEALKAEVRKDQTKIPLYMKTLFGIALIFCFFRFIGYIKFTCIQNLLYLFFDLFIFL